MIPQSFQEFKWDRAEAVAADEPEPCWFGCESCIPLEEVYENGPDCRECYQIQAAFGKLVAWLIG